MKTFYLGYTSDSYPVGRASAHDYGYKFAAIEHRGMDAARADAGEIFRNACYSKTAEGARKNLMGSRKEMAVDVITLQVVDRATFMAAKKFADKK